MNQVSSWRHRCRQSYLEYLLHEVSDSELNLLLLKVALNIWWGRWLIRGAGVLIVVFAFVLMVMAVQENNLELAILSVIYLGGMLAACIFYLRCLR